MELSLRVCFNSAHSSSFPRGREVGFHWESSVIIIRVNSSLCSREPRYSTRSGSLTRGSKDKTPSFLFPSESALPSRSTHSRPFQRISCLPDSDWLLSNKPRNQRILAWHWPFHRSLPAHLLFWGRNQGKALLFRAGRETLELGCLSELWLCQLCCVSLAKSLNLSLPLFPHL